MLIHLVTTMTSSVRSIFFYDCYIASPGQDNLIHVDNLNKPDYVVPIANGNSYLLTSDGNPAQDSDTCDLHFWLYTKTVSGLMKYELYKKTSVTTKNFIELQTGRHLYDPTTEIPGNYPLFISGSTFQWSFVKQWYTPKFDNGGVYYNNFIIHWSNDTRQGLIGPDFEISRNFIDLYFFQLATLHTQSGNGGADPRVDCILFYLNWAIGDCNSIVREVSQPIANSIPAIEPREQKIPEITAREQTIAPPRRIVAPPLRIKPRKVVPKPFIRQQLPQSDVSRDRLGTITSKPKCLWKLPTTRTFPRRNGNFSWRNHRI